MANPLWRTASTYIWVACLGSPENDWAMKVAPHTKASFTGSRKGGCSSVDGGAGFPSPADEEDLGRRQFEGGERGLERVQHREVAAAGTPLDPVPGGGVLLPDRLRGLRHRCSPRP